MLLEVPHFASIQGREREIAILRSDNGINWHEHPLAATDENVHRALGSSFPGLQSLIHDLHNSHNSHRF